MPDQPTFHSQVLDHLDFIAGMFDELGIGDVIDHATQQNPGMRDLTMGETVKAMVFNGLGVSITRSISSPGSSRISPLPNLFRPA